MVEVTITVPAEMDAILSRLTRAQGEEVGRIAAAKLAPKLTRWLVDNSQFIAGSGPFSKAWLAVPSDENPGLTITNNSPKAKFIEFPTKPHLISPGAKGFLAWMPGRGPFSAVAVSASTKGGGGWIFTRKPVHHPGTGGKGVFPIVLKMHGEDILKELAKAAEQILSRSKAA